MKTLKNKSYLIALWSLLAGTSWAQVPVTPLVNARGVFDALSKQPAPAPIAAGAAVWITGLNLGPSIEVSAPGMPWPTSLGDPPVQVTIGGIAAPLSSVSASRIVAQIPWEVPAGTADLVVTRGGVVSRTVRVLVAAVAPSVRTGNDSGFGEAAGNTSGQTLMFDAAGLGSPVAPLKAYAGGLAAEATAAPSSLRAGEFEVTLQLPESAQPGDSITLLAGNTAANGVTWQKLSTPATRYTAFPSDTGDLRSVTGSDLRGNYAIAATAADSNGCASSYLLDLPIGQIAPIAGCLTAGNAGAQMTSIVNGAALAVLKGSGEAVEIFRPGVADPRRVQLPSPASSLRSTNDGRFFAQLSGGAAVIDPETGDIENSTSSAGIAALAVDLGNGLSKVVSQAAAASDGTIGVVVGNEPFSEFKFAALDAGGKVIAVLDFPEGWAPLVAPLPDLGPQTSGPGGGLSTLRVPTAYDARTNRFYAISAARNNSGHALVGFALDGSSPSVTKFPASWFVAACTPRIPFVATSLAGTMIVPASTVNDNTFKAACSASGFAVFDPVAQRISVTSLPSQGQISVGVSPLGLMSDYIYATNASGSGPGNSDTLFYYDALSDTATRLSMPSGIAGFSNLVPMPSMNALLATAQNQRAGDAGFVLFDLGSGEARIFPVPSSAAVVSLLGVLPITRKLAARGAPAGDASSSLILYDLRTGDATTIPNPEGCTWVAGLPAQGGPGGATIVGPGPPSGGPTTGPAAVSAASYVNAKANTVLAVCYSIDRKPAGALGVRVP
ncbi:MAG: IPT/TIG domain-containing protein [Acidobacteria bacterium]|nr:IPT/TIG domain-containing protein [Acidobacteriota bacterium]